MLTKFWEGVGSNLAKQWFATVLAPAFVFWAGGLAAWAMSSGWSPETWFEGRSSLEQGLVLVGAFLLVAISGSAMQRMQLTLLRWLEGYWPLPRLTNWLRRLLIRFQGWRFGRDENRYQQLATKRGEAEEQEGKGLSASDHAELMELEQRQRRTPSDPRERMPTKLGNVLRASEHRPVEKYGLDAIVCWPRLWLVLPKDVREEITEARRSLNTTVRLWGWSILFLVWTYWTWWALPVGLISAFLFYRWSIRAAATYGDLVEAPFDLFRKNLYESLRWPLPETPADELKEGAKLTHYLWRGSDEKLPRFAQASEAA